MKSTRMGSLNRRPHFLVFLFICRSLEWSSSSSSSWWACSPVLQFVEELSLSLLALWLEQQDHEWHVDKFSFLEEEEAFHSSCLPFAVFRAWCNEAYLARRCSGEYDSTFRLWFLCPCDLVEHSSSIPVLIVVVVCLASSSCFDMPGWLTIDNLSICNAHHAMNEGNTMAFAFLL